MKMDIVKHDIKCDFCGCKNMAKYSFSTKGFVRHELVFCEDCMRKMFECFSAQLVPKSIDPPYKPKPDKSYKRRKKGNEE